MPDPCEICGVNDALGRHGSMCTRAIQLGLPRLAEDEDPIEPDPPEDPDDGAWTDSERQAELQGAPQDDIREYRDDGEQWVGQPRRMIRAQATASAIQPPPRPVELWFAYPVNDGVSEFDIVIFDSEISALRYAVQEGWKVKPLKLAEPVREQAQT
jgi:hypothetical protein